MLPQMHRFNLCICGKPFYKNQEDKYECFFFNAFNAGHNQLNN